MSNHILSKSTYMRGLKCHKSLYLNKYAKDLRDDTSDSQQYIFDQGTNIGLLAQELFPKGVDLTPEWRMVGSVYYYRQIVIFPVFPDLCDTGYPVFARHMNVKEQDIRYLVFQQHKECIAIHCVS